jgi:hypothetical protein
LTAPAFTSKERKGTLQGNRALDACHGEISNVPWDGKMTRIYHYVATLEYPRTLGPFTARRSRSTRIAHRGRALPALPVARVSVRVIRDEIDGRVRDLVEQLDRAASRRATRRSDARAAG